MAVIDQLRQPNLPPEKVAELINVLGGFRTSVAACELICWLWFDGGVNVRRPWWRGSGTFDADLPNPTRDNPAAVALLDMMAFAYPYLVEEYVAVHVSCETEEHRRSNRQLLLVALVLSREIGTARLAVDYAVRCAAARPHDPTVRVACVELIETIVGQFQGGITLFPGVVLPK